MAIGQEKKKKEGPRLGFGVRERSVTVAEDEEERKKKNPTNITARRGLQVL